MFALPASAELVTLDFSHSGAGGSLTIGGGIAIGTDIPISKLVESIDFTPHDSWTVTGTCGGTAHNGCLNFNTQTGAISITGDLTIGPDHVAGTLLAGNIFSSIVIPGPLTTVVVNSGTDQKSPALLEALHLPTDLAWDFGGYVVAAKIFNPRTHRFVGYAPTSTDILNAANVPEPGSIVLLATLLLGCTVSLARVAKRD
jgi:hypothetical protein